MLCCRLIDVNSTHESGEGEGRTHMIGAYASIHTLRSQPDHILRKGIVLRDCGSISIRYHRRRRISLLLWIQMDLNELKSREKELQLWVNQNWGRNQLQVGAGRRRARSRGMQKGCR